MPTTTATKVLSTDLNWRSGSENVGVQIMRSESEYPLAVQTAHNQRPELSDTAWAVGYEHEGERLDWEVGVTDYGKDFRADLGFVPMVDYRAGGSRCGVRGGGLR